MDIGKIQFNIEVITDYRDKLDDDALKTILSKYCDSIEQILTTLSVPISFMAHGLRKSKAYHFNVQDAMTVVMNKDGIKEKDPKKTAHELVSYFEELLKTNNANIIDQASEEIELLIKNVPALRDSYYNLGMNALVNSWTVFEAISKDLWIYCLNTYPKVFLSNLLKKINSSDKDIEGISGKNISIGLLAKYDFNISKNIGEILAPKYDFTTVRGIKQSYKDLLGLENSELDSFDNSDLIQLEITRHLLVHNAGIIDEDYKKRSSNKNESLNDKLLLNNKQISDLINAGLVAMKSIFELTSNRIKNS